MFGPSQRLLPDNTQPPQVTDLCVRYFLLLPSYLVDVTLTHRQYLHSQIYPRSDLCNDCLHPDDRPKLDVLFLPSSQYGTVKAGRKCDDVRNEQFARWKGIASYKMSILVQVPASLLVAPTIAICRQASFNISCNKTTSVRSPNVVKPKVDTCSSEFLHRRSQCRNGYKNWWQLFRWGEGGFTISRNLAGGYQRF
jgi:hypothetical protein